MWKERMTFIKFAKNCVVWQMESLIWNYRIIVESCMWAPRLIQDFLECLLLMKVWNFQMKMFHCILLLLLLYHLVKRWWNAKEYSPRWFWGFSESRYPPSPTYGRKKAFKSTVSSLEMKPATSRWSGEPHHLPPCQVDNVPNVRQRAS